MWVACGPSERGLKKKRVSKIKTENLVATGVVALTGLRELAVVLPHVGRRAELRPPRTWDPAEPPHITVVVAQP